MLDAVAGDGVVDDRDRVPAGDAGDAAAGPEAAAGLGEVARAAGAVGGQVDADDADGAGLGRLLARAAFAATPESGLLEKRQRSFA